MAEALTPDGVVCVDKPAGVSSHDIVLATRRALGEKRIGHTGTLDPFATGLLVMMVGRATRLLRYVPGDPKVYEATAAFGAETETEDLHGAVTREAPLPSRETILATLPTFTGSVSQVPPAYSAKRVGGRRSYQLARKGIDVPLAPVTVRVDSWEPLEWTEDAGAVRALRVRVSCSGGTYVRALARDLARAAGSAAHLSALRRVQCGAFSVDGAVTLADLRDGRVTVRPAVDAVPQFPRVVLTSEQLGAIVRGIDIPAEGDASVAALVNGESGVLVAVAERRADRWQPKVVMRPAAAAGAHA
ncbi:MAG TPA: tRNA pseudouridine(55) synthase TruB [Gemmatimonadaceae bacterium]|nr:tRNA pseudouridine(55) synthase TruB [Gemmatimonadaceae bacterium]